MPAVDQPLRVQFSSHVELTIHDAFLASAGALQCDPIARVAVMTAKTLFDADTDVSATAAVVPHASAPSFTCESLAPTDKKTKARCSKPNGSSEFDKCLTERGKGVRITISTKEVGRTTPRLFTCHPSFNETVRFDVEDNGFLTSLAGKPTGVAPSSQDTYSKSTSAWLDSKLSKFGAHGTARGDTQAIEDYVIVALEEADTATGSRRCFGVAYCPFSPHCESTAPADSPVRVMLQPRNACDPNDPLFLEDMRSLAEQSLDDFGYVTLSWRVCMRLHGGVVLSSEPADIPQDSVVGATETPFFPLGLTLKCTWLAPHHLHNNGGAKLITSVEFGGAERFAFKAAWQPMFLTIRSAAQLSVVNLHCNAQSLVCPEASTDVLISLPLSPISSPQAFDRDVHWAAPVRTPQGVDLGLLLASIRLSRRPLEGGTPMCGIECCPHINDPLHQEEYAHVAREWKTRCGNATNDHVAPLPDTPLSAYQPILWESEEHIAAATRRAWKRRCVIEAQPTASHVRHLFEVLMGRASLDAGVARVVSAFFNRAFEDLTAADLKEFMVACAFHAKNISAIEAARFCFVALRRDVEYAIAIDEAHYMLENSLLGKTCDMPRLEIRRWITDIFGSLTSISFEHFKKHFLHNYTVWAAFGVPLAVDVTSSSAQRHHHFVGPISEALEGGLSTFSLCPPLPLNASPPKHQDDQATPFDRTAAAMPQRRSQAQWTSSCSSANTNVWRTFVVRVLSTKKSFSVTAHIHDTVDDVMHMVEERTGIRATRQEWWLNNDTRLDAKTHIGNTILGVPSALKSSRGINAASPQSDLPVEAVIREQESILLNFFYKAKNMRWQERVSAGEKVLRLRAAVQRKTLIPLSRCVLRVTPTGSGSSSVPTLHDRHPISHYHLQSGTAIEVLQEQ